MVLEHVWRAQQMLGRPIRANEIVHHRDENKLNNAADNLEVMTRSAHRHHHQMGFAHRCVLCRAKFTGFVAAKYCSPFCYHRAGYLARGGAATATKYRLAKKLAERRRCATCQRLLGTAHRNRKYCGPKCDPWH
jgi:HNH endonuclease